MKMNRIGRVISILGFGSAAGAALGADAVGQGGDWKQAWREQRNAMVDRNPFLAYDPTSLLVKFRKGADKDCIAAVKAAAGVTAEPIETWKLIPGVEHLRMDPEVGMRVEAAIKVFQQSGCVEYAEPDQFGHIDVNPNDTYYSLLWGMNNTGQTVNGDPGVANADIDANLAWDRFSGNGSMVVGIADTGFRKTHQDLAPNVWSNPGEIAGNGIDDDGNGRTDDTWGWNFWSNNNNPTDDHGHGSHTAGTVGARGNNGLGVTGVCWNVKLAALRIANASGSISMTGAISSLDYCVGKGIKVSNHSWGGSGYNGSLFNAISNARNAGHIMCASAGNGGNDGRGDNNNSIPQYPASYNLDNIISVAAVDNNNALASFSNYGSTSVDLAAPGVTIASCYKTNDSSYVYMNGTSMATPHVTGVCALVWMRNPTWTYAQVRSRVFSTTKPLPSLAGKCVTGGVVNANNAVP